VPKQRRQKYRTAAGLAAYAGFLIAAVAWLLLYQFPEPSTIEARNSALSEAHPRGDLSGTTLLRKVEGGCRQVLFESTGEIQKGAIVPCNDSLGANSTEGRMNAIRDAFSKKN